MTARKAVVLPVLLACLAMNAQDRRPVVPAVTVPAATTPPPSPFRAGPKPYREVITDKAISRKGLFTIHRVEEKWYFEIPDSVMGRDILVVNRLSRAAAGMRNFFFGYAGDQIGSNVIRFEKGPAHRIFIKRISFDEFSKDSMQPMFTSVMNSNIQPIVAAFDVAAENRDSTGEVIEMTSYLNGDNDVLDFSGTFKNLFQVGSQQTDKSYIESVKPYPMNIEIKTVKTYTKSAGGGFGASTPLPLASSSGGQLMTMEINSSLVLLPSVPMEQRFFDPRVGFFFRTYTDFDANPQGVKTVNIAVRWKLEPREEDIEKYKRGELVEPKKPIIYYIDPATPKKWVPYLIQGVNDWQVAFEKAGFKNAIMAKRAPTPEEDSTWSIEDARFSAIVYKPSEVANASGPNVNDPRSGQILESHINWYHNVMNLLRNWYFIQAAAIDPRARKVKFDDELMGQLIRFVSSHEVGHTLGLQHNFGSSSTVDVEKLRNKAWVEAHGHTPSIMDYARFNYVAQPEDSIGPAGIYPRIGDYDKWAIEWGYRKFYDSPTPEAEVPVLNKWTTERLQKDNRLFFGSPNNQDDPRDQSEDLGNNAMLAGSYGIKNLQRIVPNLMEWTKVPDEDYSNLSELYNEVIIQFNRYLFHVLKNVGGVFDTPHTVEQAGPVYSYVPKQTQQQAMEFLHKNIFTTPTWLINKDIAGKTGSDPLAIMSTRMEGVLTALLTNSRMNKLISAEATLGKNAYTLSDMMDDVTGFTWTELKTHQPIDVYRRNLQKAYVEKFGSILAPPSPAPAAFGNFVISFSGGDIRKTDIISVAKGTMKALRSSIAAAIPRTTDKMTRYHLQDMQDRIDRILDPK